MRRARTIEEKSQALAQILRVWEQFPDWRLGQLIENAMRERKPSAQLFYIEDDEIVDAIRDLLRESPTMPPPS